jgi:hypothetical protein
MMATPRVTIPELPEQLAPDDADLFVVQDGVDTKKMTLGTLAMPHRTALAAHIDDPTAAHAASAIAAEANAAPMSGTNVQLQLSQAASEMAAIKAETQTGTAGLAAHLADPDDAHDASAISVTPMQYRSGVNVQQILAELSQIVGDGEMMEVGATPPPDTEWLWADTTATTDQASLVTDLTIQGALDHEGTTVGFYNKTPIARPTVDAAATDPATTMALVNSLRTALINLGLVV